MGNKRKSKGGKIKAAKASEGSRIKEAFKVAGAHKDDKNPYHSGILPEDTGEREQSPGNENNAFAGMILTLYSFGISREAVLKIYDIIEETPGSRKWKDNPAILSRLIGEDDFSMKTLHNEHPDMMRKISETLEADTLRQALDFLGEVFEPDLNDESLRKTLVLKIKVKGVVKPPVWREVKVPSDFSFEELHDVIQLIFGLCDCHLWEFQPKIYRSPFSIRYESEDDYDLEDVISPKVPISGFLLNKGDRMEYLYDYGDDWIMEISVTSTLDFESDCPELLRSKGDMLIEDIGGPAAYQALRRVYLEGDMMEKAVRENTVDMFGLEDEEHLKMIFEDKAVDKDLINKALREYIELS